MNIVMNFEGISIFSQAQLLLQTTTIIIKFIVHERNRELQFHANSSKGASVQPSTNVESWIYNKNVKSELNNLVTKVI